MFKKILKKTINILVNLNKRSKSFILMINDAFYLFISWLLFYGLTTIIATDFDIRVSYYEDQLFFVFFLPLLGYFFSMYILNGFNEVIRSFNLNNIYPLFFSVVVFIFSCFTADSLHNDSSSEIINLLQAFGTGTFGFCLILFSRITFRLFASLSDVKKTDRILIFGTGIEAQELFSTLTFNQTVEIVGFISNDEKIIGRELNGVDIYSISKLHKLLKNNQKFEIYIASRAIEKEVKEKLINLCAEHDTRVREISTYSEMLKENELNLKDLNISDLIPRTNVDKFEKELKVIESKVVMITGAGGSIGSEITRIISSIKIKKIILIEISEFSLFSITQEIKEIHPSIDIESIIADIKDVEKCDAIMKKFSPDIIYHAAAYKHVPILEDENNIKVSIENNFLGTVELAKLAIKHQVPKFVFVSTDKAVRPSNIMGASKRMAEIYMQILSASSDSTMISSVRFGNVIDSSGSVIPIFRKQIKSGGPVTVTHPEMVRYFMTIGEAAYLVIMASIIAKKTGVFLLKMGDPVKIFDLAKRMIALSGNEYKSIGNKNGIEIIFSGLRPGEKLYEELLVNETDVETAHPKIFMDSNTIEINSYDYENLIEEIQIALKNSNFNELKEILKKHADYTP